MLCNACLRVLSAELSDRSSARYVDEVLGVDEPTLVVDKDAEPADRAFGQCYICNQLNFPLKVCHTDFDGRAHLPDGYLTFSVKDGNKPEHGSVRRFFIQPADQTIYELAKKAKLSSSTGSEESLDLAGHWFQTCMSQHKPCNVRHREANWYPTRLLDVSMPVVRLIETAKTKPTGPYATMSHCWGQDSFLVLTSENIDHFTAGVPISRLPPNFRDAIKVTRRLGIQYIWIDCYCIVQDSVFGDQFAEKLVELKKMSRVYANSILNIGAAHGTHPEAGCFVEREAGVSLPECFFPIGPHGEQSREMYHIYDDARSEILSLASHNIFRRAWILQERLLCPRMLHFGKNQLFWECLDLLPALESFPAGQISVDTPSLFTLDSEDLRVSKGFIWARAVEDYTEMDLSHPIEDKLVAIGGIAETIMKRTGDAYAAGIFQENFLAQLCWEPSKSTRSAEEWRAPTWSWASVDGGVRFPPELLVEPTCTELVAMKKARMEMTDPQNPYGSLASAYLKLTGRLVPVEFGLKYNGNDAREDDLTKAMIDPRGAFKYCNASFVGRLSGSKTSLPVIIDDESACLSCLDEAFYHFEVAEWYILPLLISFHSKSDRRNMPDVLYNPRGASRHGTLHSLLIEEVSPQVFIRRGCLDHRNTDPEETLLRWSLETEKTITLL